MPITDRIREQIISTFRVELAEHIQTVTEGLLALEKDKLAPEERQKTLATIFRAAHSLKGAARAVGVTAVEQIAHGLENLLSDMQKGSIQPSPSIYSACYHALEAIQVTEAAYEGGATTPPIQALQSLTELEAVRTASQTPAQTTQTAPEVSSIPVERPTAHISLSAAIQDVPPNPVDIPQGTPTIASSDSMPDSASEAVLTAGTSSTAVSAQPDETIRVKVAKLDEIINQLSELLMSKIQLDQHQAQIASLQSLAADLEKQLHAASRNGKNGQAIGSASAVQDAHKLVKEIQGTTDLMAREFMNDIVHLSLVVEALENEVKQIRMLPLTTITTSFALMVRNLADSEGKAVDFEINGGDVELDKRVLELVKDPLIHLLRNAVDHGIETADERQRRGKPRAGKITLSAEQLGKDVVLSVSDDGAGLNMEAIRKAVRRHTGQEADGMSERELTSWIFTAGITTSRMVTDISGRGIGLDIVRRNVEALQGRINVEPKEGGGLTFMLTIPMALTSSRALLVKAAKCTYAIPLGAIERITTVGTEEISPVAGHDSIQYEGRPLPLAALKTIFGLPEPEEKQAAPEKLLVVILSAADRRMALVVDELLDEQEIVIKGLGKQLLRVGGIAGATVLGSGEVVLVLNPADLIKLASRAEGTAPSLKKKTSEKAPKETVRRRILVVDDSITTRTLEKHILEAEGFIVQVATDGQQALNAIAVDGMPDLVISDISMPRVNGFELTNRIKSEPRTSGIPVILVSSQDSPEDKARGVEMGADAYIVKSRFDQTNLLETIQQLIG